MIFDPCHFHFPETANVAWLLWCHFPRVSSYTGLPLPFPPVTGSAFLFHRSNVGVPRLLFLAFHFLSSGWSHHHSFSATQMLVTPKHFSLNPEPLPGLLTHIFYSLGALPWISYTGISNSMRTPKTKLVIFPTEIPPPPSHSPIGLTSSPTVALANTPKSHPWHSCIPPSSFQEHSISLISLISFESTLLSPSQEQHALEKNNSKAQWLSTSSGITCLRFHQSSITDWPWETA